MAGFVVGRHLLFPGVDHPVLTLRAGDDPVHGLFKIDHEDRLLVASRRHDGRFIDQVCEVGAAESWSLFGQCVKRDFRGQGLPRGVDLQDVLAPFDVGQVQGHLAVKASGSQQCRVQDVWTVGGGEHDDVRVGLESVHLNQDLVQGLFPLVVPAAQTGAPVAAHRVDLVHEHDTGGVTLGLIEQVPDPRRSDAHEHLHEFGTAYVEEGHPGFSGHGPGHQGLAGAGLSDQQDALGDAGAQRKEPLGEFEKLDHFLEFRFGLVHPGHVVERHRGLVEGRHLGAAAAETHGLVVTALGLAHHEQDQAAEEDQRQKVQHQPK